MTAGKFFCMLGTMRAIWSIALLLLTLGTAELVLGEEVKLYLKDGSVVTGELVEATPLLVILRIQGEIYTFEVREIEHMVLPGPSQTRRPGWSFPRLGFLGGTLAGGVVAWWGFDSASRKERDARLQEGYGLLERAGELREEARRDRKIAWIGVVGGVVCAVVALVPERTGTKVETQLGDGLRVRIVYGF